MGLEGLLLDPEDSDLLAIRWNINNSGYVVNARRSLALSRVVLERVLGRPIHPGLMADHINRVPLDNRRSNLREASKAQNNVNSIARIGVTGQRGVHRHGDRFRAQMRVDGKSRHLGVFDTIEEAAAIVQHARQETWGAFAETGESHRT